MVVNVGHQLFHNLINDNNCDDTAIIAYTCMRLATLTSYDVTKNIILYHVPSDITISDYDVKDSSTHCRVSVDNVHFDIDVDYSTHFWHRNHVKVILTHDDGSNILDLSHDNQKLFMTIIENISDAYDSWRRIVDWATFVTQGCIPFQNHHYVRNIEKVITGNTVLDYSVSNISDNSVSLSYDNDNVDVTIAIDGDVVRTTIRVNNDKYYQVMTDQESLMCARDILIRNYVNNKSAS